MGKDYVGIIVLGLLNICLLGFLVGFTSTIPPWQPDREKSSSYECGFEPFDSTSGPNPIKFFRIGILFLLFDVEVVLLIPWAVLPSANFTVGIIFLIILSLGLAYEWLMGGLEWD